MFSAAVAKQVSTLQTKLSQMKNTIFQLNSKFLYKLTLNQNLTKQKESTDEIILKFAKHSVLSINLTLFKYHIAVSAVTLIAETNVNMIVLKNRTN